MLKEEDADSIQTLGRVRLVLVVKGESERVGDILAGDCCCPVARLTQLALSWSREKNKREHIFERASGKVD